MFAFTNHTVLPEALERWPITLMEKLLPRHMQIIYDINWRFIQELRLKYPNDFDRMQRMSIIEEGDTKMVRMANLAIVASHTVNGVAFIHSELIKETIFKDFYDYWPNKFQNKTNGVTQRRWLAFCNPGLRNLITSKLGTDGWIKELSLLSQLRPHAEDAAFRKQWAEARARGPRRLAAPLRRCCCEEHRKSRPADRVATPLSQPTPPLSRATGEVRQQGPPRSEDQGALRRHREPEGPLRHPGAFSLRRRASHCRPHRAHTPPSGRPPLRCALRLSPPAPLDARAAAR